jgi:hypothetical protein
MGRKSITIHASGVEYKHALVLEESDGMASWEGPEQAVGMCLLYLDNSSYSFLICRILHWRPDQSNGVRLATGQTGKGDEYLVLVDASAADRG